MLSKLIIALAFLFALCALFSEEYETPESVSVPWRRL